MGIWIFCEMDEVIQKEAKCHFREGNALEQKMNMYAVN